MPSDSLQLRRPNFYSLFFQMSQIAFTASNFMQLHTKTLWTESELPCFFERAWANCAPEEGWNWPQL